MGAVWYRAVREERLQPLGGVQAASGRCSGDPAAITLIHDTSRGYPRAANSLAVQSLLSAYADNKAIVDEASARATVAEVTAE